MDLISFQGLSRSWKTKKSRTFKVLWEVRVSYGRA